MLKTEIMYYKTCEVCGIKAGRKKGEKRLFLAKFPLDEARCKEWVKVVGKEDLAYVPIEKLHSLKHVCIKHFKPTDLKKKKTQLKKSAVPSIDLIRQPLADDLLIGFPLHVAKQIANVESNSKLVMEHNYSKISKSPTSRKKRPHSPESLTSNAHTILHDLKEKGESDEKSSLELVIEHNYSKISKSPTSGKKRPHSPVPSTIKAHKKKEKIESEPSEKFESFTSNAHTIHDLKEKGESDETPVLPSASKIYDKKDQRTELNVSMAEQALLVTPRKRKLLKRLRQYKIKNSNLRKKLKDIEKIESPVLKSLIESSIKNQNRKAHGKRWTKLNKSVALAIYKKSPKSYRYLSQLLPMPSIRTLQVVLENMKLEPGIDPSILEHLKKKAEKLSDKERTCALLFDEMALKKRLIYNPSTDKIDGFEDLGGNDGRSERIADHALVFMLQGIYKKLKQPICYYFVKGTISTNKLAMLIETIISTVNSIGYTIINTVCDQGPTNVGAINLLKSRSGILPNQNYFLLNDEKVYIIFDVPHLFKSIRNNFLQAGEIELSNKKAKWSHLVQVEEKNRMQLRFTKITKAHVAPKYRTKMRVKTAAQMLSNTVAAILKLMSENIQDKDESDAVLQTAEVIEELDHLFDCTNGPASKADMKKNIRTNVSKNSFHHKLWPKYKETLKTLKFLKSDSQLRLKNVRCVNGYITTLSSLENIWERVASKGFKFLNLRQLNQDALENLFGMIRQHSPTNRNPTCHHFKGALKSSILTRLSTPLSRGSNCEKDENEILFDFHDIVFPNISKLKDDKRPLHLCSSNEDVPLLEIPEILNNQQQFCNKDVPLLQIPEVENTTQQLEDIEKYFKTFEMQPTVYVSGYIAYAVLKNINCVKCRDSLAIPNPVENSIYNYISLREWWKEKQSLTYPSIKLCETVDVATKLFEKYLLSSLHRDDLCAFSKTIMFANIDFTWVCDSHKNKIVDVLTQRLSLLLIRNQCKIVNRSFAMTEESTADSLKKAQQQGIAK